MEANSILVEAVKEFNLSTSSGFQSASEKKIPGATLSVWDGQTFVMTQNGDSSKWWDIAKLLWKYGLAPMRTLNLMRTTVGKYLKMYDGPVFPFDSLTQAAQDVGLLAVTAATGEQYLRENGITGNFGKHIVQASTRVNYAQNLVHIHALEAMVCMATDGAMSVEGGNWRIFDRMLNASNATTLLQTEITRVEKLKDDTYALKFSKLDSEVGEILHSQSFDGVILAAPYQFANIETVGLSRKPDEIPYVQLHVTLFTSPHLLSPTFFNLAADKPAPRVILTTLPEGESPGRGSSSVGTPGFFSISLLDPILNPKTGRQEYLYKIFSPAPPTDTFLSNLLGVNGDSEENSNSISENDITWIYRKVWCSYPYEYPRVTFEDIRLAPHLWYTSSMDSFISTMETNALMGKNIARLVVDQWLERNLVNASVDAMHILP